MHKISPNEYTSMLEGETDVNEDDVDVEEEAAF